jgi:hypothetical protein
VGEMTSRIEAAWLIAWTAQTSAKRVQHKFILLNLRPANDTAGAWTSDFTRVQRMKKT